MGRAPLLIAPYWVISDQSRRSKHFKAALKSPRINTFSKLQCNYTKLFEWREAPTSEARPIGLAHAQRDVSGILSRSLKFHELTPLFNYSVI